ncbi:MAG: DNA mismatch repair endonuclease MutL [Labilithrix sp.]|nr:DNA mismatch repair endonuclease MutL [Labilithrix sp.]
MGRIRKLSDDVANQIAAGEVVERPSSVVKELVENALDAEATRVVVDVEQGGTTLVRVTDDGVGMGRDDAMLCLERHATSKIVRFEDLTRIGTFGFRGEALPSIASVSRLTLRTRARDAHEGVEIEIRGGGAPDVRPAGGATGTTIEVRDLFFNVPARRKFLKATATESAHVGDVLLGMALARPDVTFVLSRDGRPVREYLRAASRAERARAVMSGEKLAECRAERGALGVEAMLAPPERARAGATGLSVLVNGRPVRDRMLARAVAQAYGSVLEGGRYPLGVVWIDVPPELVDVNVHPQKAEVRFADARGVFDAVTRELHGALATAFGLPPLGPHPQAPIHRPPVPTLRTLEGPAAAARAMVTAARDAERPELMPEGNLFALGAGAVNEEIPATEAPREANAAFARLRYVGQVRGTFLVCEGEDGLYVLDQHAAAERVTFDRLKKTHAIHGVAMQRLLVPEVVELSPSEVAILEENADEVSRLGVEVRSVGDAAVAVHGVPRLLARAEPARIVRDLVAEVSRAAGRPFRGAVDLVLATMACHGSVRAGDALSREEVEALLVSLDRVDFSGHCPHGRPLVMRMTFGELERRVGR